ncbi:MAG: hypothetical protein KGK09_00195, partial [Burkholderiales bacterium]|nr:hypothetical protein [Burkholderiales bacterium]
RPLAAGVVALALLMAVATRLPGMHYEARALLNPAHVLAAPLLFALFVFWLAGLPALYARWLAEQRAAALLWPAALALQAVLGWALVREAVLPAMIHKVAGYPVLGWPWHWETLLRFSALEVAVAVLLTGGCIAARALQPAALGTRPDPGPQTGPRSGRAPRVWLFWAALLLPVLHLGIVVEAATDNLTELMVDGGGLRSSAALVAWGLLVGLAGSLLAQAGPGPRGRIGTIGPIGRALALAVLSVPLGGAILAFGLESQVHKYGATFSALQFMLSADRQHYAVGWALALRYLMFHAAVVAVVALAQRPFRSAGSAPDLRGDP